MAKTLIAFFSRADENYFSGAMRYVKVGNTEIVAGITKELIPADTFKIEMKNPYSPVYMSCIEEAKRDLRAKAAALAGKNLVPFSTHEGSGLSGFDKKLSSAIPGSKDLKGLAIRGNDCQNQQEGVRKSVNDWIAGLEF